VPLENGGGLIRGGKRTRVLTSSRHDMLYHLVLCYMTQRAGGTNWRLSFPASNLNTINITKEFMNWKGILIKISNHKSSPFLFSLLQIQHTPV
jgi:hypothetical protein